MYGYEDKTYNEVLTQAVNNIEEINQAVDAICEKGYKNLYLVGTGGTYAMASPLSYLIKTNSTIPWYYEIAAELVTAKPKQLSISFRNNSRDNQCSKICKRSWCNSNRSCR